MMSLVYYGPGKSAWEDRPRPVLKSHTDAIVRITRTTICGTDLHILKGDVPTVAEGRVLGHEGVGVVEDVGSGVSGFRKGDRVLISCITSCGRCGACRKGMYSHCVEGGGWILGHLIDGTQAEYVRIPFADTSLFHIPRGVDEEGLVMLSDVLPTGYECGVLSGGVRFGDTVAIVGAGPIGLACVMTARLCAPAEIIVIDLDDNRLETAKMFGATQVVHTRGGGVVEQVMSLTSGKGVDVAVEAVGLPSTFELCQDIVAAGGHVANVGVHGRPATLRLDKLWAHNITITTRLVDTVSTPLLIGAVASGRLNPKQLVTHHFSMQELLGAYETFQNASTHRALKVIIRSRDG